MPDDFGIRYSCAFIDADGDRMYFLGEDHTGEGGPPTRAGGTGKYGNIDFEIRLLDVRLVFGPERQLEGLIVDYDIRWNSQ